MIKNISGFEWAGQIALLFSSDVASKFVNYSGDNIKQKNISPSGFFEFSITDEGEEFWMDVTKKVLVNVGSSIEEVRDAVGGTMKKDMKGTIEKLSPAEAVEKLIFAGILMAVNEGGLDKVYVGIAARIASGMSPLEAMGLEGLQGKQSTSEEAMQKLSLADAFFYQQKEDDAEDDDGDVPHAIIEIIEAISKNNK